MERATPVAINTPAALLRRAVETAKQALERVQPQARGVLVVDDITYAIELCGKALASTAPVASESRGIVPEGWVLVPRVATEAMRIAATKDHEGDFFLPFSLWKSMLAAAPTPPAVSNGEPPAALLHEVLTLVEFDAKGYCLVCGGWNVSPQGCTPRKHTKDCKLAKLLARSAAAKGEG